MNTSIEGKKFLLSGYFKNRIKKEIAELIASKGGIVLPREWHFYQRRCCGMLTGEVRTCDYVVANKTNPPSRKVRDAGLYNVPVIDEDDLFKMLLSAK